MTEEKVASVPKAKLLNDPVPLVTNALPNAQDVDVQVLWPPKFSVDPETIGAASAALTMAQMADATNVVAANTVVTLDIASVPVVAPCLSKMKDQMEQL